MKTAKFILSAFVSFALFAGTSSCVITAPHDNGKHAGWYKNPQNPHNPQTTRQSGSQGNGNANGKSQGNGKSKK